MRLFDWKQAFSETPNLGRTEILERVNSVERQYWMLSLVCVLFMVPAWLLMAAGIWSTKLLLVGIFVELDATIVLALVKIQANVNLSALRILWQLENRYAGEQRQMQAADL